MMKSLATRRSLALPGLLLIPALLLNASAVQAARHPAAPVDPNAPVDIKRLGAHACVRPPLKTGADLQKLFKTIHDPIVNVLTMAGFEGDPDDLFRAVEQGKFEEKRFPIGQSMQWMMTQRQKKKFTIIRNARWAGKEPFVGWEIKLVSNKYDYTFIVPSICGNLSLVERTPVAEPPQPVCKINVSPASDCITRQLTVDASGCTVSSGQLTGVAVSVTGPGGKKEDLGAPSAKGAWKWTKSWKEPGTYTFTAVATADSGRTSDPVSAKAELKPCPPNCAIALSSEDTLSGDEFMVDASGSKSQVGQLKTVHVEVIGEKGEKVTSMELAAPFKTSTKIDKAGRYTYKATAEDDLGQRSTNSCEKTTVIRPRTGVFTDLFAGKERRVRPEFLGGRCAPLIGAKAGVSYLVSRSFELAWGAGAAFNLRDGSNHSVFADMEMNLIGGGGFFGTGIGIWDITRSNTRTASWLIHGGFDIGTKVGWRPMSMFVEGRLPLNKLGDIDNNYIIWGGLRFRY